MPASTDATRAGRRRHDVATRLYDGVAGIYGGDWSGPVYVLAHRSDDRPGEPRAENRHFACSAGWLDGIATSNLRRRGLTHTARDDADAGRPGVGSPREPVRGLRPVDELLHLALDRLPDHLAAVGVAPGDRLHFSPVAPRARSATLIGVR